MTINKFGSSLNHDTRVSTEPSRCIDQCLKSDHAVNEITTVVEKKLNEGVDIPRFQTDYANKKYVDNQLEVTEALSRQLIISKFNELSTEQNIKLNEIEERVAQQSEKMEDKLSGHYALLEGHRETLAKHHYAYIERYIVSLENNKYDVYIRGSGYHCFGMAK